MCVCVCARMLFPIFCLIWIQFTIHDNVKRIVKYYNNYHNYNNDCLHHLIVKIKIKQTLIECSILVKFVYNSELHLQCKLLYIHFANDGMADFYSYSNSLRVFSIPILARRLKLLKAILYLHTRNVRKNE